MKLISDKRLDEITHGALELGRREGFRLALLDCGFVGYEYSQPDPEVQCYFSRYGQPTFISQTSSFHPAFNIAGLYWKECK